MSALTDVYENKLVDFLFRAQALGVTGATAAAGTGPANLFVGLFTANPTDVGGGTEVTTVGTNYGRLSVASSLVNWAGTQAPASTAVSSGTNGTTSNNGVMNIGTGNSINAAGAPTNTTANVGATGYGVVTGVGVFDAVTGGNLLFYSALTTSKTVNASDPVPSFAAGALTFQIDN
jgi:hypothetical protein